MESSEKWCTLAPLHQHTEHYALNMGERWKLFAYILSLNAQSKPSMAAGMAGRMKTASDILKKKFDRIFVMLFIGNYLSLSRLCRLHAHCSLYFQIGKNASGGSAACCSSRLKVDWEQYTVWVVFQWLFVYAIEFSFSDCYGVRRLV